ESLEQRTESSSTGPATVPASHPSSGF
ncbi:hypothetical protein RRG08_013407, partial [Elysia crispata]